MVLTGQGAAGYASTLVEVVSRSSSHRPHCGQRWRPPVSTAPRRARPRSRRSRSPLPDPRIEESSAMLQRFGPWSSALGDGLSPHLSTFWKRRLAAPRFGPTGPPSPVAARLAEAGLRPAPPPGHSPPSTWPRPTAPMMPSPQPPAKSTSTPTSRRARATPTGEGHLRHRPRDRELDQGQCDFEGDGPRLAATAECWP